MSPIATASPTAIPYVQIKDLVFNFICDKCELTVQEK